MFIKLGEDLVVDVDNIMTPKEALENEEIASRFVKLAKKLKKIAPKADDFLYFSCIMMHAAEASLINQETGMPILNKKGEPVSGRFVDFKNLRGQDSVKWESKDGILPYKNKNGDIFGEGELLKAYKKWRGKPLCKDHVSDSVDGIRGIIIDTHYDPKFKRVHALCALDRKNYGDLARKVEAKYATSVSMGTGVAKAICTECGNVATSSKDVCSCIKQRINYGEINIDLNPIELSLVVNGADGLAKVRKIIASMNKYVTEKDSFVYSGNHEEKNTVDYGKISEMIVQMKTQLDRLSTLNVEKTASDQEVELGRLTAALNALKGMPGTEEAVKGILEKIKRLVDSNSKVNNDTSETTKELRPGPGGASFSALTPDGHQDLPMTTNYSGFSSDQRFAGDLNSANTKKERQNINRRDDMNSARMRARAKARRAYWLGGGGINDPQTLPYDKDPLADQAREDDRQNAGVKDSLDATQLWPGDKEKKEKVLRAEEMLNRAMKRRAYWQGGGGVGDPANLPYAKDPLAEEAREKLDTQMHDADVGSPDGLFKGDKELKEKVLRAKLKAKFVKVASGGVVDKKKSFWEVYADDQKILVANGDDIYGDEVGDYWDYLSSQQYGKDVMSHIRRDGFEQTAYLLKGAADPLADLTAPEAKPDVELPPELAPAAEPMPAPAATAPEAPAPAPEALEPKEDVKSEVDLALNAIEENLDKIRETVGDKEATDVEVDVGEVQALMDASADELALISEALDNQSTAELLKVAKQAISDSKELVKFAKSLTKDVAKKKVEKKKSKKEDDEEAEDEDEVVEEKPAKKKMKKVKDEEKVLEKAKKLRAENRAMMVAKAMDPVKVEVPVQVTPVAKADDLSAEEELFKMLEEDNAEDCAEDCAHDGCGATLVDTKEARDKMRSELVTKTAEKVMSKYQLTLEPAVTVSEPTFFQAHPGGKGTVTELTHSKTDEALVETIAEVHEKMKEVALSGPRNVREAAMEIQEKVVSGSWKVAQLADMVAKGEADSDAVEYWKKYWGQAPDHGNFGTEMTKEFDKVKKESSNKEYEVKMRRAYSLALEAQEKGFIGNTKKALEDYVDNVMKFNDEAFESTKRIIASMNKVASSPKIPLPSGEAASKPMVVTASSQREELSDVLSKLSWS